MTSEVKTRLFHQYLPMMEKFVSNKNSSFLDKEEIRSQVYLIFAETCERYQESYNCSFGTYLYSRMKSLNNFILENSKEFFADEQGEDVDKKAEDPAFAVILDASLNSLSKDAGELLLYIVDRKWETPGVGRKAPSHDGLFNAFAFFKKWTFTRFDKSWKELKAWYNENYYLV